MHTCAGSIRRRVWLVDFDRGALRTPGFWCDGNLVRLRRSLEKDRRTTCRRSDSRRPTGHRCSTAISRRNRRPQPPRSSPAHRATPLHAAAVPAAPFATLLVLVRGLRTRGVLAWRLGRDSDSARLAWAAEYGCTPYRWARCRSPPSSSRALRERERSLEVTLTCATPTGRAPRRARCCPGSKCDTRPTICQGAFAAAWRACARGC